MTHHPDVPAALTELALTAEPMLERCYLAGGGSLSDLRTDLSHALAAVLHAVTPTPRQIDLTAYEGPERRRSARQGAWS